MIRRVGSIKTLWSEIYLVLLSFSNSIVRFSTVKLGSDALEIKVGDLLSGFRFT